jgi:hypothetical protein
LCEKNKHILSLILYNDPSLLVWIFRSVLKIRGEEEI